MLTTTRTDGKLGLNILQTSPLDQQSHLAEDAEAVNPIEQWRASRYNIRATAEDGRLILWNTLSGAMSVFQPHQAPHILALLKNKGLKARREGIVDYLAERGFLVRINEDEYRQFLLRFGRQHYQPGRLELILMSSEDCNFRCEYCYEDFARGTMQPRVRTGIKRFVERQVDKLNSLYVSWFGGEPLYGWAAIEELGPFFSEIAAKHDIVYGSHMTTNGYLLTPDVVDKILAWQIDNFQITLDGAPENHDRSRPTRDGRGTFWTIFDNLRAMSRRKEEFSVTLRVNFDNTNHARIDEFLELVEREFRHDTRFGISFHAVGQWGGDNDANLDICGADKHQEVMLALKAAAHRRGLHFGTLRDVHRFGSNVCYAARPYNFLIGASGKVMKCTVALDKEEHNVVGHLTDSGDMVIDADRLARWTEPAFERDSQCQKCVVLPSCQGISCPLPRIESNTRPCIPTRRQAKSQLTETLLLTTRSPRKRTVMSNRGNSGQTHP